MADREAYIDDGNRDSRVAEWLSAVHPNGRTRGPELDPSRAALLVLDMQRYFLDPDSHAFVPSAPLVLRSVEQLARNFRAAGRPVICTRHVDDASVSSPMSLWWKYQLKMDDPRSQLDPAVQTLTDRVIVKHSYDSFLGTDLEQQLHDDGVTQLVLCGVVTHLCVETTARSAFCRGFPIFLPCDCTATWTEAQHRSTLQNLSHGFARITSLNEMLEKRV